VARKRLTGAERRERILDAAETAFGERGYAGASVGEIAEAAGITKPVLYDHFSSKHELFVAIMERARDELTARGAAAMSQDAPERARVRHAVEAFFDFVEEHPAAVRVLFASPRETPELVADSRRVQAEATVRIAGTLSTTPQLARRRAPVPELYGEFLKAGLHALAEWWMQHPDVPRRRIVDAGVDLVWGALGEGASDQP
jgi:AcrR family transcriptional regulator